MKSNPDQNDHKTNGGMSMKQFIVLLTVAAFCVAVFAPTIAATQFDPNYWHHPEMDDIGWIDGSPRPSGDDTGWDVPAGMGWQGFGSLLLNSALYLLGYTTHAGAADFVVSHNCDQGGDTQTEVVSSGGAL